jgi:large subunit ribosomal protein L10
MAKVELKAPIVEEIKANLEGAKSVVLVDYLGLTVEQDTNLRRATREAGLIYKVYKNTMVKRAIEGTEFAEIAKDLEGPTAVAISKDDATAPARVIANFAKTAPKLEMKSGIVEGTYYDTEGIKAISQIPSREELLSRLLGSLQSPITNLARVINQVAEQKAEA